MFKSILTFTAIIAVISAQAAEFNYHPATQVCFEEIKATVTHANTLAKSFSSFSLGQVSEAVQLLSEAKSAKNSCAGVPYSHIAKYAAETKAVFTDMCIENIMDLKQKIKINGDIIKGTKSLTKMFKAIKSVGSAAKAAVKECKHIRKN